MTMVLFRRRFESLRVLEKQGKKVKAKEDLLGECAQSRDFRIFRSVKISARTILPLSVGFKHDYPKLNPRIIRWLISREGQNQKRRSIQINVQVQGDNDIDAWHETVNTTNCDN